MAATDLDPKPMGMTAPPTDAPAPAVAAPRHDGAPTGSLADRYRICPQLRVYDGLEPVLAPYLTFTTRPHVRSEVVNTDRYGFRISYAGEARIDTTTWWDVADPALVVGDSVAFGVGSTQDRRTLVSQLNGLTGYQFLNLGIRAGNSTQGLIAALPFVARARAVIVCSGINTLVAELQSLGLNDLYGPLFGEEYLEVLSRYPFRHVAGLLEDAGARVSLRVLLAAWAGRLRMRRTGRWAGRSVARADAPQNGVDLEGVMRQALARQGRDLVSLAKLRSREIPLVFAVQPLADCCGKALSPEEAQLFRVSDALDATWVRLKPSLLAMWPTYVERLRQVCEQERIRFVDLNQRPWSGWCFVDRVHLTDQGYSQAAQALAEVLEPLTK